MSAPSQPPETPAAHVPQRDETEEALRRIRQVGLGLLVGAMVIDIAWQEVRRTRMRTAALKFRVRSRIDPPGPIIASVAVALLESTSPKPPNVRG